jgi:hypothetical protein
MMSITNKFALILILQIAFLAIFLQRAPFMMTTTSPSSKQPWADTPCSLITTPQYATKKVPNSLYILKTILTLQTDIFTVGATHMAHIHNAILRGYNSIYLQAPHISEADKPAFIGYALTWYRFVKSHHDDEEAGLFPKVAELLGSDKIWEETHKEHGKHPSISPQSAKK